MAYIVKILHPEGARLPERIEVVDLTVGTRGEEKFRVIRMLNLASNSYDTIFDVVKITEKPNGYTIAESNAAEVRKGHHTPVEETLAITKAYLRASRHITLNNEKMNAGEEAIKVLDSRMAEKELQRSAATFDDAVACYPV
ncbi:MAG: hypothetical protein H6908_06365 [Hyphomicrobiales bacterium]|nr:hypothetical protein [Hyphomicrobiales bacterium]